MQNDDTIKIQIKAPVASILALLERLSAQVVTIRYNREKQSNTEDKF